MSGVLAGRLGDAGLANTGANWWGDTVCWGGGIPPGALYTGAFGSLYDTGGA